MQETWDAKKLYLFNWWPNYKMAHCNLVISSYIDILPVTLYDTNSI